MRLEHLCWYKKGLNEIETLLRLKFYLELFCFFKKMSPVRNSLAYFFLLYFYHVLNTSFLGLGEYKGRFNETETLLRLILVLVRF